MKIRRQLAASILAIPVFVAACSSSPPAAQPTQRPPDPTATPKPFALEVVKVSYDKRARVGGAFEVTAIVKNTGSGANATTEFQFGDGIEKYADLEECRPKCTVDRGFGGGYYLTLPGVKPGKSATFVFQWLPTKVGVSNWSVCVYDDASFGEQLACYEGTTTIR